MRRPRKPGTAIDNRRVDGWLVRFAGYRRDVTTARINDWLVQWKSDDRDLAARVLDCVEYVSHESIENTFKRIVEGLPGWAYKESDRRGRWRFVAFSKAAGESGDTMLHRFRSAAKLAGRRYDALFINKRDLLREQLEGNDTVVFVDDFAGTGDQACDGWRHVMEELLPGRPRVYLVLVAVSRTANERISMETPMQVRAGLELKAGDNIFGEECAHFSGGEQDTLLRYCRRANHRSPRGYGDCGFVLVLAHKTPNNSIPVLHVSHPKWTGLFPRV